MWKTIYTSKTKTSPEQIDQLLEDLTKNTCTLSDEEIIVTLGLYSPSLGCEGAATGFMELFSQVGPLRPTLAPALFMIMLRPMYYLGIEAPSSVEQWISDYLAGHDTLTDPQKSWMLSLASKHEFLEQAFTSIKENESLYFS